MIENFLADRSMKTVVSGNFSEFKTVFSGVPLLFVLFINDLPSGLDNFSKLIAEDLK